MNDLLVITVPSKKNVFLLSGAFLSVNVWGEGMCMVHVCVCFTL